MNTTIDQLHAASTGIAPKINDSDETGPLVDLRDLHVDFPRHHDVVVAVDGIDLQIRPGESVGLIGESGSGKSVTARTILGLAGRKAEIHAESYNVVGQNGLTMSDRQWREIRGKRIGMVLQDALTSLDPLRTVRQEITEALTAHGRVDDAGDRGIELLDAVGMPDPQERAEQYPHELSGGLRQRALIASAIAGSPELLIADEPTTALDVSVQAQILDLLKSMVSRGMALLLVSHDLAVVAQVCERILVMKDGKIVEQGPTADVLANPREDYTKMLLAAVPSARTRGTLLASPTRQAAPHHDVSDAVALTATGLVKEFEAPGGRTRRAVNDVDLTLHKGETLGIVGESGSGKTTLARLLVALAEPSAGTVEVDGQPWSELTERERRPHRKAIQIVTQDPLSSFDPRFSVADVVGEPLRTRRELRRSERRERVLSALADVGLGPEHVDISPRSMSGGQRQRVSIARAIVSQPQILLADEPVSALDVSVQAQVLDLLIELRAKTGMSMVFVSHDLGVIHHLADSVAVMKDGEVVEFGSADAIFTDPKHPYTRSLLAAVPTIGGSREATTSTHISLSK